MSYAINYHPQAEAVLSSLMLPEQHRVRASIGHLAEFGPSDPNIAVLSYRIGNAPTYALRVGDNLRVLFTTNMNTITVMDVLNQRLAERYG